MRIRDERPGEGAALGALITEAFRTAAHASGTEARIVDLLRADGALALSLVAEDETGTVTGHLAASEARIGAQGGWGLIGPLAVRPDRQGQGVGSALMASALARLRRSCRGAVLVGDPGYYTRFGLRAWPGLTMAGVPPEAVLALPFDGAAPVGALTCHPAFALDTGG